MIRNCKALVGAALAAPLLILLAPAAALAHPVAGSAHGALHGLFHPMTGADHVLAMFAVGLWAAQRGGRDVWRLPLVFVGTMLAAGAAGMAGLPLPAVEAGIMASVLLLGAAVAFAVHVPAAAAVPAVALFAVFHGHAHGSEMPAALSGAAYGLGFAAATTLLHAAGIAFARFVPDAANRRRVHALRMAGAGVGVAGLLLLIF
jgi:urease accessory protein